MPAFLRRIIYGWAAIFLASVTMVGAGIFYYERPILIAQWRPLIGLLILLGVAVSAAGFKKRSDFI